MSKSILPGATIGVLGSGQLGRMFAIEARRMGYHIHVFSPDRDTPAGQVADLEIQADYADREAVLEFARRVDVITLEFENVPVACVETAARFAPVHPGAAVLKTTQHRLREKEFLNSAGLPVTPFAAVHSRADLYQAIETVDVPAVLKTVTGGYDGKGQIRVDSVRAARRAWELLGTTDAVLERWVDLECELSVISARNAHGEIASFEPILNKHSNHILDTSVAPANISRETSMAAIEIAETVIERLQMVGVLCVEFFLTADQDLLINELAPRPHNSGHLTIEGHVTNQFQQHVRAVCGLPLGSSSQLRPVAMVNLLGDLWFAGEPNWQSALSTREVNLHLYGKQTAREGRKMGHLTAVASTTEKAIELAWEARNQILKPVSNDRKHANSTTTIHSPGTCLLPT